MSAIVKPTTADRLAAAWRALVRAEQPSQTFLGTYSYAVQATDGKTVDAAPTDTTIPLPPITKVPIYTGLPGTTCKPAVGSILAIGFLNGDPSRPFVAGVFDGSNTATAPLIAIAGPLPTQAAARVGDAVGPFLVTTGSTKVSIGG
jgi:hypothetical protein